MCICYIYMYDSKNKKANTPFLFTALFHISWKKSSCGIYSSICVKFDTRAKVKSMGH